LATLTVATDRIIGIVFCVSLGTYAIITRRRDVILTASFSIGIFSALMVASYHISDNNTMGTGNSTFQNVTPEFYTPTNLFMLLAIVNGLIAAPAELVFSS
jgi:hypothetical protein